MIDVLVTMPGATPKEVEERLSIPMEKLLYELPGVEYIYSTSMPAKAFWWYVFTSVRISRHPLFA